MLNKKSKLSILSKTLMTIFTMGGVLYNSNLSLASEEIYESRLEIGSQISELEFGYREHIKLEGGTFQNIQYGKFLPEYGTVVGGDGGAVRVYRGSSFEGNDLTFQNNTASISGAAIYNGQAATYPLEPSESVITNSKFLNNTAIVKHENGPSEYWVDNRGGAVFNEFGSKFTSISNHFEGNSSFLGGAIYNHYSGIGALTVPEGVPIPDPITTSVYLVGDNTFISNFAFVGGAVANFGTLFVDSNETIFENNFSSDRGGAFANLGNYYDPAHPEYAADAITTFEGNVTFQHNWSENRGGGAVANYSWNSPVEGIKTLMVFKGETTFKDNKALNGHGGAILNSNAELQLIGNQTFSGNTSEKNGGAIANLEGFEGQNNTFIKIAGISKFISNSANNGGALYNPSGFIEVDAAEFKTNEAKEGNGGAIQNGGLNDLKQPVFIGQLSVQNSTFEGNIAKKPSNPEKSWTYAYGGGAVMNMTGSSFTSSDNKYLNNKADNVGGAIHNRQGQSTNLILSGQNIFDGNSAYLGGGAIFNDGQLVDGGEDSVTIFRNNKSENGFGGALFNIGGIYTFENGQKQESVLAKFSGTVIFENNSDKKSGGAVANIASPKPTFISTGQEYPTYHIPVETSFSGNVSFIGNQSLSNGGAVYNRNGIVSFLGNLSLFTGNQGKVGGALSNFHDKEGVEPASMRILGDAVFENNTAKFGAGAIYNNANFIFGQGNHIFRGNSVENGTGGAIYNFETGVMLFGGSNYFESNTAEEVPNDIFNKGRLILGADDISHRVTVINGGITGPGSMELNSGRLVLGSGAQIHQASFTAKAGTMTTVVLSDAHHVHDKNVAHFDELADENGTGHDKVATAVSNDGFGIHTTGQMTLEKGAVLNIVSDDIQAGHTYLVAYNEKAPEATAAKMARATDTSVVINPAGFEHDETSWKGDNLITSNQLVKLERLEGDNTNGYILVTGKDSNSVNIIQDLAGLDQVYFSWLSDLEDLRQRLGEVRLGADNGIWTKVSYARYRASGLGDGKVKSTDYSIHVGADGTLYKNNGHKFFAGFSFKGGHTDMKAARAAGTGDLNHYTWKLYGTYVHEKGSYADIVASVGTFNNRFRGYHDSWTGNVHGDVNNWGAGISGEVGHQFRFLEESAGSFWFAEPQIQLSYFRVKGKNYETSNAIHIEQKSVNFLTGRVGVSAGKQFAYGADKKRYLQLSAKAGLIHEFSGDQKLRLNGKKLSADGKKNLFYYGADMDWQFADNHKLYLKVDRATGSGYRKDIQIQGGYRYSF